MSLNPAHLPCLLVEVYMVICVVRIIFSWLPPQDMNSGWISFAQTFSYAVTEPVFATVRKAMPQIGDLAIDFSPVVVFLGLGLIKILVC